MGHITQLNTIYRCIYYFEINKFKLVQYTVVISLFKNAVYALQKEKKFSHDIVKQGWLCELHTIRDNMPGATALDDKLDESQSNENHVLTSVLRPY